MFYRYIIAQRDFFVKQRQKKISPAEAGEIFFCSFLQLIIRYAQFVRKSDQRFNRRKESIKMIENGFVKLPRSIAKRSWFNKQNTLQLYVVLLLNAAFKDFEYDGMTIRAGQYITSLNKLMEMTGQTKRQIRTALDHLKASGDLTIEASSKFSIITLNSDPCQASGDTQTVKRADTCADTQNDNRSISNKKEVIKEESTKEEKEEAANAASSSPASFSEDFLKQRLVQQYGSDVVELYENKFKAWGSAKNVSNIPMYPTIAKWLAQDKQDKSPKTPPDNAPKTSPKTTAVESVPKAFSKSPAPVSDNQHIDTAKLRAAVMAQYKKA